jgi:hypothetical protein
MDLLRLHLFIFDLDIVLIYLHLFLVKLTIYKVDFNLLAFHNNLFEYLLDVFFYNIIV